LPETWGVLIICVSFPAWPQSQAATALEIRENELPRQSQAAKIKNDVQKRGAGEKSRVKVSLQNKTDVKG